MTIALVGFALVLAFAFVGVPLGFSMMVVGMVGFMMLRGFEPGLSMVTQQVLSLGLDPGFAVLPLYILMGGLVARARLSDDLYEASNAALGHLKGGLAIATIAACGGFAAICGSSTASALAMGKIAIPSMRRYKYPDGLSLGVVAAGGTLGFLIPPSTAMIIYGLLTSTDIAQLFVAGILPGLFSVLLLMGTVVILVTIWPEMGPAGPRASWSEMFVALGKVWGIVFLFFFILGGIFFGLFTTTEAGGMGAVGALAFAVGRRKLGLWGFFQALIEAGRTTAMIFTVAFGTLVLNQFINVSGLPRAVMETIEYFGIGPVGTMVLICVIYLLLGIVVEGIGMIFLTVPLFLPIVQSMGFDLIWFGIIVVIAVEISLIHPPIGLNAFLMKTLAPEVPLNVIFRGLAPFVVAQIVVLFSIMMFPQIALFLPSLMK